MERAVKPVHIFVAGLTGLIVGLLYLGFEWLVNNGTNWLWNDLVQSDTYRWRVIPLAIVMSVVLSIVITFFGNKRVLKPASSLLDELDDIKQTSLYAIFAILVIGALSLLAGASLGPEASLVAASTGMTAWFSAKIHATKQPFAFVLSIASLGALLAAFFDSVVPILIPLLILKQKKKLNASSGLIVTFTGLIAWLLIHLIKEGAYIEIPVTGTFSFENLALATVLGFLSVLVAAAVKRMIKISFSGITKINKRFSWFSSSLIFGLILGVLYLIGGQTVQFSGSEGLKLLSENPSQYGLAALCGLIVVKLLATSWSLTSGYRGGLVFPSIYMGVTLSLAFCTLFGLSGLAETGTNIGAVTGILMGMINPIVGIILAFAMFPLSQFSVTIGAIVGTFVGLKLFAKLLPENN